MAFLLILNIVTLAGVAYLAWQVYLLREQIDSIETRLFRMRLLKNRGVRHANIDGMMGDV